MALRTLQRDFVGSLFEDDLVAPDFIRSRGASPADRLAIYRHNAFSNYRNALADVYPVVLERRLSFRARADPGPWERQ